MIYTGTVILYFWFHRCRSVPTSMFIFDQSNNNNNVKKHITFSVIALHFTFSSIKPLWENVYSVPIWIIFIGREIKEKDWRQHPFSLFYPILDASGIWNLDYFGILPKPRPCPHSPWTCSCFTIFQSRLCTDLDYTYLGLRSPPPFAISLIDFNMVWWWSISAE